MSKDDNAACLLIGPNIFAMLLVEDYFRTFIRKEIADASRTTEVLIALSADSRAQVDEIADKALASGGSPANDPQDHGFMYSRSFQDPDGHIWEVLFMEPNHIEQ